MRHFLDTIADSIHEIIEADLAENQPEVSTECTGIGWNEFWGHRSFDKGETYPVMDNEPDTVRIDLNHSKRALKELVRILGYDLPTGHTEVVEGKYDETTYRCYYKVESFSIVKGGLVANIEWTEVEDFS